MNVYIALIPGAPGEPSEVRAVLTLGDPAALVQQPGRALDKEVSALIRTTEQEITRWLDAERARAAGGMKRPNSTLPSLSTSPSCKGCGTAVEKAGELCPNCAHKGHLRAPEPSVALVNQGEPAYKTKGNFRDAPREREEEIVT